MEVSSIHVIKLIMTLRDSVTKAKTAHILVLNKNKGLLLSLRVGQIHSLAGFM